VAQARVGGVAVRAALLADLEPLLDAALACNKLNAQHGLVSGLRHLTLAIASHHYLIVIYLISNATFIRLSNNNLS